MATYNLNITASSNALSADIPASQETTFSISNPLPNSSYFTFETVRNSNGFYDSDSPKNMAGIYTLGAGLTGVVKSDYIASVVVEPGGGNLTFTPDNYITGSSLNLRGTSAPSAITATGFDIDAQAFFTRVTDAGGTLSTTEQDAVNTLVVQMKADGIWTKMKAMYPMVGASAAACAQNLKSSSFTGTFSSGWTFASTGVTPNGTSAFATTGLNVNTLATNSISLGFYSRTNTQSQQGHYIDASISPSARFGIANFSGIYYVYLSNTANFPTSLQPNSLGFFQGYRNNTTNVQAYKNNTKIISDYSQNISALINKEFEIGRNTNTNTQYMNEECAFAYIGDGLTDTEASDFYTAVQAFNTTLSRQV